MSWTAPATWNTNDQVSAADLNAQVRDNLTYLAANTPYRATLWHRDSIVTSGNDVAAFVTTSQDYNHFARQNAAADGDTFTQSCVLAAGTYTLYLLGTTANDSGLIDWDVDGSSIATGQDWYSAGTTFNVLKSIASITVSATARVTLTGTVNGKNGSSSDYFVRLTKLWFQQASD